MFIRTYGQIDNETVETLKAFDAVETEKAVELLLSTVAVPVPPTWKKKHERNRTTRKAANVASLCIAGIKTS